MAILAAARSRGGPRVYKHVNAKFVKALNAAFARVMISIQQSPPWMH
jgi:hypothetical protein